MRSNDGAVVGHIRTDIQSLRALAVAAVVLFHAQLFPLSGGFLGVDVFFVISGFLVTGMILRGLDSGSFSFAKFYVRRADRLLPAAFCTFAVTTAGALFLLTSDQLKEYLEQLAGSLTFTSNFVLAAQSGYFDSGAAFKPLLHIWSLSLEEQFYFIMPVLLACCARRYRLAVIISATALSLAVCQYLLLGAPSLPIGLTPSACSKLAFYMLPARAWELLAGSIGAWIVLRHGSIALPRWLRWAALAAVFVVIIAPLDPIHPRFDAILAVLATAIILIGKDDWLPTIRPVVTIGDWSYSIYLIHWPLLAFSYSIWAGEPPMAARLAVVVASLFLGWAQYRFVETPFRHGQWRSRAHRYKVAGVVVLGFATPAIVAASAAAYQPTVIAPNLGLGSACAAGAGITGARSCVSGPNPAIIVWGDSFAMQWVRPISNIAPVIQLTRHACAPLDGLALQRPGDLRAEASACAGLQRQALARIIASPIRTVVMAGAYEHYFDEDGGRLVSESSAQPATSGLAYGALLKAVDTLQKAGKRVIMVAPVPSTHTDWAVCNERIEQRLISGLPDCSFPVAEAQDKWRSVYRALRSIALDRHVMILWPAPPVVNGRYQTAIGNDILFADGGHVSYAGGGRMAETMGLRSALLD